MSDDLESKKQLFLTKREDKFKIPSKITMQNVLYAMKVEKAFNEGKTKCKLYLDENGKKMFMFYTDKEVLEILPCSLYDFQKIVFDKLDLYGMQKARIHRSN